MSTTSTASVSAAELRRRVRAVEAVQARTRELAAAKALTARENAKKAAQDKKDADLAAQEGTAAVLRLFDNDVELVAELLGVPADELEREAKPVTAARAKEVIEELRALAERPRIPRRRSPRTEAPPSSTGSDASAPAPAPDGSRTDGA